MVDLTVDNNTATTKRDEQQQQDGTMTLTDGERQRISKYVDLEFQDAKPDKKAKTADQFLFEEKHGLEDDTNESLDDVDKAPEGQKMLEPRAYQYELYQKATQENVIAVLDTGSGKTLIAVMLIKDMVNKEKQERLTRRHVCLFLCLAILLCGGGRQTDLTMLLATDKTDILFGRPCSSRVSASKRNRSQL